MIRSQPFMMADRTRPTTSNRDLRHMERRTGAEPERSDGADPERSDGAVTARCLT